MSKRLLILMCSILLVVPLAFMGCGGSDGAAGPAGPPGPPGPPGATGPQGETVTANATPETCAVCHRSTAAPHAATVARNGSDVVTASVVSATMNAGNTVATIVINVKVAGVDSADFGTISRSYGYFDNVTSFVRVEVFAPDRTITPGANGNYTVTLAGDNVAANRTFMVTLSNGLTGAAELLATVVAHDPSNGGIPLRDVAGNDGCVACHGTYVFDGIHHGANPTFDACVVCHVRDNTANFVTKDPVTGVKTGVASALGKRLTLYVHGIHNSHNMPDGVYYRNTGTSEFSVGYPSDIRNCIVCHTGARGATAAAAPVSYSLCMSCHVNWDGFVRVHAATPTPVFAADNFHRSFTLATNCMACHAELLAMNEVSDFHNDFQSTDSHYDSFFGGTDISFDNPDNVLFAVTGVSKSGDNVTFTWTATRNGVPVNPCNDNLVNGPTFQGLGAYLAYAKGDDWVNENVSASQAPGQPLGSRGLFVGTPTNPPLTTTCASNVATTTGLKTAAGAAAYAQKALLAIGGKPLNQGSFLIGNTSTTKGYFVRVPSPTYAFSMTNGSAVAARRNAVDTAKCNRCHRGTLYQHGGDRVDNEQMCVICHNPSSSEKNVRVGYGILNADNTVNRNATYDGKTAETYDMRYLLHAVHGADKRQNPIVIYRGRGIFAFAAANAAKPAGWPTGAGSQPIAGSKTGATQTHTWTVIDYPRRPDECLACHNAEGFAIPDQTKAVPLTVEPGTSWTSQADDIVIGPAAAACTACHDTSVVRSHAVHEGYMANVLKETMLELAQPTEFLVVTP